MEMRVARDFRTEKFNVIPQAYYVDDVTAELRETDVLATRALSVGGSLIVLLHVVAECKYIRREAPWVGLSQGSDAVDSFRVFPRLASPGGLLLLNLIEKRPGVVELPLFALPKRIAYGLVEAFSKPKKNRKPTTRTGVLGAGRAQVFSKPNQDRGPSSPPQPKDDSAHSAVRQLMASARSRTSLFRGTLTDKLAVIEIVVPALVVNGPLLELEMNHEGEADIRPVDSLLLALNTYGAGNELGKTVPVTFIQLVQEKDVPMFARGIMNSLDWIRDNCQQELEAVAEMLLKKSTN